MSVYLDVVCSDRQLTLPERRENTLRAIGEILPFVMAKYQLGGKPLPRPAQRPQRQPRFET